VPLLWIDQDAYILLTLTGACFSACEDGTLHLWATNSNMSRPSLSCDSAHQKYTETSGIVFAKDGKQLATRGGDDTVKREYTLLSGHAFQVIES